MGARALLTALMHGGVLLSVLGADLGSGGGAQAKRRDWAVRLMRHKGSGLLWVGVQNLSRRARVLVIPFQVDFFPPGREDGVVVRPHEHKCHADVLADKVMLGRRNGLFQAVRAKQHPGESGVQRFRVTLVQGRLDGKCESFVVTLDCTANLRSGASNARASCRELVGAG